MKFKDEQLKERVRVMSEKQKEALNRFGAMMENMTDRELENLLLVGEGMVIMAGIKEAKKELDQQPELVG